MTIRARRLAKAPQRWVPMMGLSPFAQGDVRGGSFLHTAPGAVRRVPITRLRERASTGVVYRATTGERMVSNMWTMIVVLVIAWAVLAVVGFAFEGLLWLGVIGVILFFGTIIFGLVRRNRGQGRPTK